VLDFQLDGVMMGSELQHANAPAMVVTITDPSTSQQPQIRIYKGTNNGNVAAIVASGSSSPFTFTDDNLQDGTGAYYFADISMGNYRTVSSPIWYQRSDNGSSTSINNNIADPSNAALQILNNPVTNALVSYRLNDSNYRGETTLCIRDMNGKVLIKKATAYSNGTGNVDIASLPGGIYFLSLSTKNATYVKRFVKP